MKILVASSEVYPYAKTGGLADVAGALPLALARRGHDVRVVMPLHRCVDADAHHLLPVMKELDVCLGEQRFRGQVLRATMGDGRVPIYFLQNDALFDRAELYTEGGKDYADNALRFAFASLATIWMLKGLDWSPDVIQANDWQTALIPAYLRHWPILSSDPFYSGIKILYTIHNLAYQGLADPSVLPEIGFDWSLFKADGFEFFDQVNLMKGGLLFTDHISTVSPTYAEEIQTEAQGAGLSGVLERRRDVLVGILNGIDTGVWDPATDPNLAANYSREDLGGKAACKAALQRRCGLPERADVPLVGMISRLVDQKGFDLIESSVRDLMGLGLQLVVLGTGLEKYQTMLEDLRAAHPDQVSAHFIFDEELAHQIEAGADLFLMPSRYEPCGLNQQYSMRYGTVPVVRKTGGLADSVTDASPAALRSGKATGFVFEEHTPRAMLGALQRGLKMFQRDRRGWERLMRTGMGRDFSWQAAAKKYERLFKRMTGA